MKTKTALGFGFALALVLVAQFLGIVLIRPVVAQQAPTVFKRAFGFNPPPVGHWNFFVPGTIGVGDFVYEMLTHYFAANGTYVPGIAESWTVDPNYMWFTVNLKHGVKFHDGHELTVKDVLSTLYTGPYLNKDRIWYYIKDVKIVNDYTLNFTFTEKTDYPVFYILWHWDVVSYTQYGTFMDRVVAKIQQGYNIFTDAAPFNEIKNDLMNYRPESVIGCGPYKVKSVSETMVVLEKFTQYYGGDPPFDEIHLIKYASTDLMWTDILNGDLDYVWTFATPEQLQALKAKTWAWTILVPRSVGNTMYINKAVYPLNLVDVRRALAYGINRTEVGFVQYPGGCTPSQYVIGWHTPDVTRYINASFVNQYIAPFEYKYNPTKAQQLLTGLGFTKGADGIYVTQNGTRLEFELSFGGYINAVACEDIAAQLLKIGIKVTVRSVENAVYFASPDGPFYVGGYQLGVGVYGAPGFAFDEYYHKYMALFPGHHFGQMQSVPWKTSPVNVTALAKEINLFPAQISQARLTEIYSELSYITGDQVPVINLYAPAVLVYLNRDKFAFPTDAGYWNGLGSYETHGFSWLLRANLLRPKLTLTVSLEPSGGGTLSLAPGVYSYGKGDQVTVTATPASGYSFKAWELDGQTAGTSTSITVTVSQAHSLKAVFERIPYEMYALGVVALVVIVAGGYYLYKGRKPKQ